jgi:hypothetical protein
MEGYGPDNEYSQSQIGQEWSQNSEWMTRFPVPNFSENPQLQFAHGPNMFTSGQSAFEGYPTPPYRRLPYSEDREIENIGQETEILQGAEILEVKREEAAAKGPQLVARKRARATPAKEKAKKKGKKTVIELGSDEEEEATVVKWKDIEVETLIAIRGKMEEEFSKTANKQGMSKHQAQFFLKLR